MALYANEVSSLNSRSVISRIALLFISRTFANDPPDVEPRNTSPVSFIKKLRPPLPTDISFTLEGTKLAGNDIIF